MAQWLSDYCKEQENEITCLLPALAASGKRGWLSGLEILRSSGEKLCASGSQEAGVGVRGREEALVGAGVLDEGRPGGAVAQGLHMPDNPQSPPAGFDS